MGSQHQYAACQRILVFNCHEPWVYQLRALGRHLDIIVGLPGHYHSAWDQHMRPVPPHSRLITLEQALQEPLPYYAIIAHNLKDLLDIRPRPEPRLLILHISLEAKAVEEKASADLQRFRNMVRTYVATTGTHPVAVTRFKASSWGLSDAVVHNGIDPDEFLPHTGETACGLRVCNFILRRPQYTLWDFHHAAFRGLPVRIVGHNPGLPCAAPSHNWDHLRTLCSQSRFFIHTADPALEDGFNMAVMEAMAAGLPVLGNRHPTSPIVHGVNGFVSDDPVELRTYAAQLLADRDLAHSMGQEARTTATEQFGLTLFKVQMQQAIEVARRKQRERLAQPEVIALPSRKRTSKHRIELLARAHR